MNNLAELNSIDIDRNEFATRWDEQVAHVPDHVWGSRNYVELSFFTDYFSSLLTKINDTVKLTPKNYVIQVHDKKLIDAKWYLNITHKDDDRLTCITIPILYNRLEPIRFYKENTAIPTRGQQIKETPMQTSTYSEAHPTLVNVNNWHNVRLIDDTNPRILLQLSYDVSFDDIISLNPAQWNKL